MLQDLQIVVNLQVNSGKEEGSRKNMCNGKGWEARFA
jgi:hypothetical protein